jgi:LuxR family maltose regulon positive regulatory protein
VSAQAQAPLLATKLHAPDPRERIGREALVARLSDAPQARLALIRAPAGWGKSTLLAQWRAAEQGHRPFAWLTLDSADSDPTRFWTYAVEALREVAPDIGAQLLPLLRAPGVDLPGEMLPVLIKELSGIPTRLVLALDDYHRLEGDSRQRPDAATARLPARERLHRDRLQDGAAAGSVPPPRTGAAG